MSVIYDKAKLVFTLPAHMRSGLSGTRVVHVVLLQVITFHVRCCDVYCNFRVHSMSIRIYFICFVEDWCFLYVFCINLLICLLVSKHDTIPGEVRAV